MNKRRKLWALIAAPGLAVTGLLLAFLLLGRSAVGATPDNAGTIPDLRSQRPTLSTVELVTDTVLNVECGCVCSGVWVTETVDSDGGPSNSLALAPTYPYTPHISYLDDTPTEKLKHASLSGTTWFTEVVDAGGKRTSLALAPTYPYTPCISHHCFSCWNLRYACLSGTTWITRSLDCCRAGLGGTSLALEPTYPYTPHISYDMPFGAYDLKHTYLDATAWMSGTWMRETVDSEGMVGGGSSLALEPTYPYTPHISYCGEDGLKHAWKSDTTWFSEIVDSECALTSLALDSSGNPHISYLDFTNRDLKYAWRSGTTWFSTTVDSEGDVGHYSSLALDSSDNPYISYADATEPALKLAHFDDGTGWTIQVVESEGWFPWTSLALDQVGCPHISYYDATNGDLKYAYQPIVCGGLCLPVIFKNY